MSKQASVAIDACIRGAATAMAGVMRRTKAGRADKAANAQVETVCRGSLSGPKNEKTQNRSRTQCNFCCLHFVFSFSHFQNPNHSLVRRGRAVLPGTHPAAVFGFAFY
jgi:hypothetical protein